jgi:hypothetical protein
MKKVQQKENEFVSFRSPVNRMIKWWKSKESDDVKSALSWTAIMLIIYKIKAKRNEDLEDHI